MTRILIVEDEESYREPLVYQLTREGYDVSAAASGEEGLELFTKGGIDLVLLDLMLPGIDGTALCRRIREQSRVRSSCSPPKSAEIDKVVGLEIGADDYVTKPYSFRELLARIRAVLRRNQGAVEASGVVDDDIPLVCGDISMQVGQHQVTVRGEKRVLPAQGIRTARIPHAEQGARDDPTPAHRPHLGLRLRRRHEDPRRARQARALQDRGGSGPSPVPDHRARPRLQDRQPAAVTGPHPV